MEFQGTIVKIDTPNAARAETTIALRRFSEIIFATATYSAIVGRTAMIAVQISNTSAKARHPGPRLVLFREVCLALFCIILDRLIQSCLFF